MPRSSTTATRGKRTSAKRSASKAAPLTRADRPDARDSDCSPRVYVATSSIHGKGMFAVNKLRADIVLGRLAGMPTYDDGIYVLWLNDELGLEVTNDWRFINHSKNPNCALTDTHVVTLKAIRPDEELTHDYGW